LIVYIVAIQSRLMTIAAGVALAVAYLGTYAWIDRQEEVAFAMIIAPAVLLGVVSLLVAVDLVFVARSWRSAA
jgi:hypothetical protein